jgi:hypothetical protein
MTLTVSPADADRAAQVAAAMTRDHVATGSADLEWDAQEVLGVALSRGLRALELLYLPAGSPPE